MTPAHHKARSREWESRLTVSRVLLRWDRTPTTAAFSSGGRTPIRELLVRTCSLWNAGTPEWREKIKGSERKVRSGTYLLSTNLRIMKTEASPLSLAAPFLSLGELQGCYLACHLELLSPAQLQECKRASSSIKSCGFSVPTRAFFYSPPDRISRNMNKTINTDMRGHHNS